MANPFAKYAQPAANPFAVYSTPAQGPKAPSGYQAVDGGLAAISGGPDDPNVTARRAAMEAAARAAASTPIEVGGQIMAARARAAIETQARMQQLAQERAMGPKLTGEDREKAIKAAQAGNRIDTLVADMERLYRQGPGATSGVAGLQDYLPTTANKQFDAAGNSVRGDVGQALGFTGGQLNSIQEANMAVGPYLPQSSDRDAVILDKIDRLKGIARDARERAVKQLGSDPEAASLIGAPAAATSPPAPPPGGGMDRSASVGTILGPNGGGAPQAQLSGNSGYKTVEDPLRAGVNARLNQMLQSGATDDQVRAYLGSIGVPGAVEAAEPALKARQGGYKGAYTIDLERQQVPLSTGQTVLNAVGAGPVGAYFTNAADAATAGTLDNMTANPAMTRAIQEGIRAHNPNASLLGAVTGGALAAGGLELGMGALGARAGLGAAGRALSSPVTADALYGAATGAGNADEGSRLLGAAAGGTAGVVGGMFGRGIGRGIGGAVGGVRNADVQALRARGVPVTAGQAVGGALKGIEDRLTGIPVVGDVINNRRREGFEGFNRAAFDEALAPINRNTGGAIREQGVDAARAARSQAYRDALDNVNVQADTLFVADMQGAVAAGRALPDPMRGNLDYTLPTRVGNSFGQNGELTGQGFQQSIRGLRQDARSMEQLPYGNDFGNVTRQAEGALEGLLQRQSPGALPAYQAANAANRNVEIVRDAVNRGRSGTRVGDPGLFAPSQLADAAAANSKRFGGTQGTTAQPFYDLTRQGQRVLPSSVPDSGTAGRLAVTGGLAALGGGGAGVGYLGGDTSTGAAGGVTLGALLALGGTRGGQQALVRILADRPDLLQQLGRGITDNRRVGGMFGAGLGASLLTGP